MSRKPPHGRGGKPEPAQLRRAVPPPPAGLPLMPRPFATDDLHDQPASFSVKATQAECAAMAEAFGLPHVASLTAEYSVRKQGRIVTVRGRLKARLTQNCVVTLEPFESDISDEVEMTYAPESIVAEAWARLAREEASGHSSPADDPPDLIVDGRIDLGALTAEALALALDPYPKKPGVEFELPEGESAADKADDSPFAVLAGLSRKGAPKGETKA
ncbi:MAG: YceD family protein [Beijerinckiaceae bacterium]|nr:YceD family protein [Beijerinckiaceae bacterium]